MAITGALAGIGGRKGAGAVKSAMTTRPTPRQNAASTARLQGQVDAYNAAQAAQSYQAPAPQAQPYYGGGGGYAPAAVAATPVAPPRLSDDEWLKQDSQYKSAVSALEQKLRDFEVENTSTRERGTQDYDNSLLRLGWIAPTEKGGTGSWNQEDRSTAYGNAYQGQMGDFAARGLLQSTLYDQARNDMLGNFNRQRTDMDTAQTSFLEELARALSTQKSDTQLGKDQARVQALARRAAAESGVSA